MYKYLTTTQTGFVQQAMKYLMHSYFFYVRGFVRDDDDEDRIDQEILEKYGLDISRTERSRRKKQGFASVQYLRHDRDWVLMATDGKSTTAQALGAGLIRRNFKVLLTDLDPQSNMTYSLGVHPHSKTAYDLLKNEIGGEKVLAREVIQSTAQGDVIPASNALTASHRLIIPAQADIYSIQGIDQLASTIKAVKTYCNSELSFHGMLLTRHNKRANLSNDLGDCISQMAQTLGTFVYKSEIRECIALKEAQAQKQDIFTYAPKSNAAFDCEEFVEEFLERIKQS